MGYGITAPECAWDDYAGVDAKGKVAIALRHEPFANDDSSNVWLGKRFTRHARFEEKARNAKAHGAVALLIVPDLATFPDGKKKKSVPGLGYWKSTSSDRPDGRVDVEPPAARHAREAQRHPRGDRRSGVLAHAGARARPRAPDPNDLRPLRRLWAAPRRDGRGERDPGGQGPRSRPLPTSAISGRVTTKIEGSPVGTWSACCAAATPSSRGATSWWAGTTITWASTKVGSGGTAPMTTASGASAVLAIAASLRRGALKRSVIFVNFAAEEVGLLGSFYFAAQPPGAARLDLGDGELRHDRPRRRRGQESGTHQSVARGGGVRVGIAVEPGVGSDPEKANVGIGLTTTADETFFDRSDQAAFYFEVDPDPLLQHGRAWRLPRPQRHGRAAQLRQGAADREARGALRRRGGQSPRRSPFVDLPGAGRPPRGQSQENWAMGITNFLERSDL